MKGPHYLTTQIQEDYLYLHVVNVMIVSGEGKKLIIREVKNEWV